MRFGLLRSALLLSLVMLLACDKPSLGSDGHEAKGEATTEDIASIEKSFAEQRSLIEEARVLKAKAESGDPVAAKRWWDVTREYHHVAMASLILNRVKESAAIKAKSSQLSSIHKEMRQVGWNDIRPIWISAKLGDADAQNEVYDLFTSENLGSDDRVILKGSVKWPAFDLWGHSRPPAQLPQIEVLADSYRLVSYSYLVDSFWTPPVGRWDPLYVEGRYRYDGIEFSPRDWLIKAAATDSRFKAKLAAVDFVSAKNEADRIVAAKALLSVAASRGDDDDSLVKSCLAAIYSRGISVPVDLSKAADIMLSSRVNSLQARGVKLVCEHNLPHNQKDRQLGHEGEGLLYAVYSKYGYGHWKRDFERAYFEYWLFLCRVNGSPGGDANFARMELSELEKRLSAEEVISLQKKCQIWRKKFDGKSPYVADWDSR